MNKMLDKQELERKIQELTFSAVELNLFLDTHPNDAQALQDYQYVINTLQQLKDLYNQNYGPLLNFGYASVNDNYWNWVSEEEKWPWENV